MPKQLLQPQRIAFLSKKTIGPRTESEVFYPLASVGADKSSKLQIPQQPKHCDEPTIPPVEHGHPLQQTKAQQRWT